MVIKPIQLRFTKRRKTEEIIYGACWHLGNPNIHSEGIAKFIERAQKQIWFHDGDLVEGILPFDKRFDVGEHEDSLLSSRDDAEMIVRKASKTCAGLIRGNHDDKASRIVGDIVESVANSAGVDYLGYIAYLNFMCDDCSVCRCLVGHGTGTMNYNSDVPERDEANRKQRLRRKYKRFEADVVAIAHYHRPIVSEPIDIMTGCVEDDELKLRPVTEQDKWIVACPSMFKNYGEGISLSYAEAMHLPPQPLGWMGIVIDSNGNVPAIREYDQDGALVQEYEKKVIR